MSAATFTETITISYEDVGGGDALVLVHGHPFDRTMWRGQVERFSRAGYRVIAADLRGYGQSSVVPGATALSVFARDIVELLDHLGIEQCVLGGLSMGGQIVMECQRLYPERLRGLVLADTTATAETAESKRARYEMAERLLVEGLWPYADEVLPRMVAPHNLVALPAVAAHVLAMMRATWPEGAAAALRGRAERPDYVETLASTTVPTLVVVGSEDEFTPVVDAELIHSLVAGSTLAVIDGAAHMPNLERPDEFDSVLLRFLDNIPASARNDP